jgi:hypothetical protein
MKRIVLLAMALLVPGLLFLNAWQGYRYHTLSSEVAELEKRQKATIERNMGTLARIAYERSRERIEKRAADEPGLAPIDNTRVTRVVIEAGSGAP